MLCPGVESRWPVWSSDATLFATQQGWVCTEFPNRDESWTGQDNRNADEAGFPAGGPDRIPLVELEPAHRWGEMLFLCDEYQSFATVGESDPTVDESSSRYRGKLRSQLSLDLPGES